MVETLGLALVFAGAVEAHSAPPRAGVLRRSWRGYKRTYVERDGRVVDPRNGGISTSEGQAYGMLRAVWIDDRRAFRKLQGWTLDELQGGDPVALPAWKWADGSVADPQPASDADQLMAYALLLAWERWGDDADKQQALGLMKAVWDHETVTVGLRRVVVPGPWALTEDPLPLNPSYFLPFCWRAFAEVDPSHPWMRLVGQAYDAFDDYAAPSGLPQDWVYVDPGTGEPVDTPEGGKTDPDHHGFEAFRTAWTLALEVAWYDEPRARALLVPYADLGRRWRSEGWIPGVIKPDGTAAVDWAYPGFYGALLSAWAVARPEDVDALYVQEIKTRKRLGGWADREDYFSQNWIWFGLAAWTGVAQPPVGT